MGLTLRRLAMRLAEMDSEPWSQPAGSWASSEATRKKMMGNRSRDTSPELRVRSLVHGRGLRVQDSPEVPDELADLSGYL